MPASARIAMMFRQQASACISIVSGTVPSAARRLLLRRREGASPRTPQRHGCKGRTAQLLKGECGGYSWYQNLAVARDIRRKSYPAIASNPASAIGGVLYSSIAVVLLAPSAGPGLRDGAGPPAANPPTAPPGSDGAAARGWRRTRRHCAAPG